MRCVRRLGTIIQSIFCAQWEAGIRLNFWKWSGESRYPGAFSPVMKTFVPPFLPTRLTAPGSPRMGVLLRATQSSKKTLYPNALLKYHKAMVILYFSVTTYKPYGLPGSVRHTCGINTTNVLFKTLYWDVQSSIQLDSDYRFFKIFDKIPLTF